MRPEGTAISNTHSTLCLGRTRASHSGSMRSWNKTWLFATSYAPLAILASRCNHPSGHPSFTNRQGMDGQWASRDTAEYPESLALAFAEITAPLMSTGAPCTVPALLEQIPVKSLSQPPHTLNDGGGLTSTGDWSTSFPQPNRFKKLRQEWTDLILQQQLHKHLTQRLRSASSDPPFDDALVHIFRDSLQRCLTDVSHWDWSVDPDQPFCLHAMQALSELMQGPDIHLFPSLLAGVPTGFNHDIPPSHVFTAKHDAPSLLQQSLSQHFLNWKSAEDNPDITNSLLQEEIQQIYRGVRV